MPDRERKSDQRQGPSTEPVDEGLEGAIFDERDARRDDDADLRDLDDAATGKGGVAPSRSGEGQGEPAGSNQLEAGRNSGEETPPDVPPS